MVKARARRASREMTRNMIVSLFSESEAVAIGGPPRIAEDCGCYGQATLVALLEIVSWQNVA